MQIGFNGGIVVNPDMAVSWKAFSFSLVTRPWQNRL
jgi:hypothetical protein